MLDFQDNSTLLNILLFVAAAAVVWIAGMQLERQADAIARRTGLGQAFMGMLLLAAGTSLPEIATVVPAALMGSTSLAVHNLLGSVVFNTVALVIADAVSGKESLSHRAPRYVLLIEGIGVVFLLAVVLAGAAAANGLTQQQIEGESGQEGGLQLLDLRIWETLLLITYAAVLYATYQSQSDPRWGPLIPEKQESESRDESADDDSSYSESSNAKLGYAFAFCCAIILVAGWLIASTGDALAEQTGLGASFVGFVLVALATTLPEISTTIAAARRGGSEMAFSNIFGSSAFVVVLLGFVGLFMGREVILQVGSPTAIFSASLGILLTCVYIWGLLERQDRTIYHLGWDSMAVIILAIAGSAVMYVLK